jgi:hypothetical protein
MRPRQETERMETGDVVLISLPQLLCPIGMLTALCAIARSHQPFAPFRDAALGLVLYVGPASVLWSLLLSAFIHETAYGRCVDTWPVLVWFAGSFCLFLGMSAWAFKRRDYRWYREPVVSILILTILWLIIFPIFASTHCRG